MTDKKPVSKLHRMVRIAAVVLGVLSVVIVMGAFSKTLRGLLDPVLAPFIYTYAGLLAAASIFFILLMVRFLVQPEPRGDYLWSRLADWWPFAHFVVAIVYLLLLVNAFALIYWVAAVDHPAALRLPVNLDALPRPAEEKMSYWTAIYFSITTFTTTGYGDITPGPLLRLVAAAEMLVGYTIFGVFVTGTYQLLTRSATGKETAGPGVVSPRKTALGIAEGGEPASGPERTPSDASKAPTRN